MNNEVNQIVAYTNYEGLSQFHIFIKKSFQNLMNSLATKLTLGCGKNDEYTPITLMLSPPWILLVYCRV